MLVDEVDITVKAGNGGNGAGTFLRTRHQPHGGPDGGDGGIGGSIYFVGTSDLTALNQFQYKKHIEAENGGNGSHEKSSGKRGKDMMIKIPYGTTVTDKTYGDVYEIVDETPILVAAGARGGHGNFYYRSATNQSPTRAEHGRVTPIKELHLILKFIAQIGLIGLPNAGKSSLLEALTAATPKIADYPFTTLEPNLGVMKGLIIADIPGLIEGASTGKGLGIEFLKHIEKTEVLLHCVDVTIPETWEIYETVRNELRLYNKDLLKKKEIVLLTKIDMVEEDFAKEKMEIFKKKKKRVLSVSAIDDVSLGRLKVYLGKMF